jgi:hypothetical protein
MLALAACAATALLMGPDTPVASGVALAAAGAVWAGLWSAGWLGGRHRIVRVTWLSGGGWRLTDQAGSNHVASLRADARVVGRWLWLSWRIEDRATRRLFLGPGDLAAADLRRLIVRLRVEGVSPASVAGVPGA